MEYKLLEKEDLELMLDFIDDENTIYSIKELENFINEKNTYGFIVKDKNKITAFAYGYILTHPNGKKVFYLDAIDVMKEYQGKGTGTNLMKFISNFAKEEGCYEMFLLTNKSNVSACKCYKKSGAKSASKDDVVFVYDFEGEK